MRVNGGEVVEITRAILIRGRALHLFDAGQSRPGTLAGGLDGTDDQDAFPQPMPLDERCRHVGVRLLGGVVPGRVAKEAKAFGVQFENALRGMSVVRHVVGR